MWTYAYSRNGELLDTTDPAGAASTTASHIRSTVIGSDGASTITESPFVRDRSLGPALWAVRIPPGGRLQSVEYLDDAGRVLDHIGPTSA